MIRYFISPPEIIKKPLPESQETAKKYLSFFKLVSLRWYNPDQVKGFDLSPIILIGHP